MVWLASILDINPGSIWECLQHGMLAFTLISEDIIHVILNMNYYYREVIQNTDENIEYFTIVYCFWILFKFWSFLIFFNLPIQHYLFWFLLKDKSRLSILKNMYLSPYNNKDLFRRYTQNQLVLHQKFMYNLLSLNVCTKI